MARTRLSVNLNKVALIRNARGGSRPDLVKFAQDCESYGAEGITVHPRPDERHIRFADLHPLKEIVATEFNIEGYPNEKFIKHVCEVKPHQVTLVPDPPGVLTSDSGWDTKTNLSFLQDVIATFHHHDIRVSLFLNPDISMVESAKLTGAERIELYTGEYANNYIEDKVKAVKDHVETAKEASSIGLGINAGHDLDLDNLNYYVKRVPELLEVSIGHALVSDALYYGIQNTIGMYKHQIQKKSTL